MAVAGDAGAEAALRDLPGTFAAAKNKGNDYFRLGDMQAAVRCYVRAFGCGDASPGDRAAAAGNIAQCELRRSRPKDALDWAERALVEDPTHVKNLYRRGVALDLMGRLDDAKRALQRAAEAGKESGTEAICADVARKLEEVSAKIEKRMEEKRQAQLEKQRLHDMEVALSRPAPTLLNPEQLQPQLQAGKKGYRENDWVPWLCDELWQRSRGDPQPGGKRLHVFTATGLCMTYVPDRLPVWGVLPGTPEAAIRSQLKMEPTNISAMPAMPPVGQEVTDLLVGRIVQGDIAQWRNGHRAGLRYDFKVYLWWRCVETALEGGDPDILEGTLMIEANDETPPSEWRRDALPDLMPRHGKRKDLDQTRLEAMLAAGKRLASHTTVVISQILEDLQSDARKDSSRHF